MKSEKNVNKTRNEIDDVERLLQEIHDEKSPEGGKSLEGDLTKLVEKIWSATYFLYKSNKNSFLTLFY